MKLSAFAKKCIVPALFLMIITACKKDGESGSGSSEKKILTFKVDSISGVIDEANHTININLTSNYSLNAVPATITISENATVSPALKVTIDLTKPFIYTVKAENGSTVNYTVTGKIGVNNQAGILSFKVTTIEDKNPSAEVTIDSVNNKVFIDMYIFEKTDRKVKTNVQLSYGATSVPGPNDIVDFSNPVHYVVKAENGSIREYDVMIRNVRNYLDSLVLPVHGVEYGKYLEPYALNSGGLLLRFIPQDFMGMAGEGYVMFYALESDDLFLRRPYKAVISPDATVSPSFDLLTDYTKDVVYKISSQSGAVKNYRVRVIRNKVIMKNMALYQGYYTISSFSSLYPLDYRSNERIKQVWAVDTLTQAITPMQIQKYKEKDDWGIYHDYIGLAEGYPLAIGTYRLKVKLENGEEEVTRYIFSGKPPTD